MDKLFEMLEKNASSDYYPYHMPGHKRRAVEGLPSALAELDITEIDGFDNLHQPQGILLEIQKRAAAAYGAEESFCLVGGSTCGVLAAISAAVPEGGHLLMARNSHKSAYHAAYLRKLTVSYLFPRQLEGYDFFEAITPEQVKEALDVNSEIQAVFITSPTYEGRIAEIGEIAKVVHARGIPLIVDEAHGAHLGFEEGFAQNSCRQGADLVVHSLHKTMPALTQSAMLHVNGSLVQRNLLKRFLKIYQSSSPSYLLMAGIDSCLGFWETEGEGAFRCFREHFARLVADLEVCRHLAVVPLEGKKQDVGKLVIVSKNTDLSGKQIYDILLEKHHLQLEMAAGTYCLAMFTVNDGQEAYDRMREALLELDACLEEKRCLVGKQSDGLFLKSRGSYWGQESECSGALPLWKAWDMECKEVPLKEATGKIAGEFVCLYPPGVPVLVPGERILQEQCELLAESLEQGLTVQGVGAGKTVSGQGLEWLIAVPK